MRKRHYTTRILDAAYKKATGSDRPVLLCTHESVISEDLAFRYGIRKPTCEICILLFMANPRNAE